MFNRKVSRFNIAAHLFCQPDVIKKLVTLTDKKIGKKPSSEKEYLMAFLHSNFCDNVCISFHAFCMEETLKYSYLLLYLVTALFHLK